MIISYSFGMVDFLHYGHISVMKEAKKDSDLHIWGLVSDDAVDAWLGTNISNYDERKSVLEQLKLVDEIMLQESFDPTENLKTIHSRYPNAEIRLYHGDDWKVVPAKEYLDSIGGKVVFLKYYDKLSPDRIYAKLSEKNNKVQKRSNLISTKANTLLALKPLVKKSIIEDIYIIQYDKYKTNKEKIVGHIGDKFNNKRIVVRSSSKNEDCYEYSNAGHFESILGVVAADKNEVMHAVDKVFLSYSSNIDQLDDNEQVLIQTMTESVSKSGVIFTRDINENRPYYLINYDNSGSTDAVTSGSGGETIWISRNLTNEKIDEEWRDLIVAVRELEEILNNMVLDIEFAICKNGEVVIFQVRPLAASYKFQKSFEDDIFFKVQNEAISQYSDLAGTEYAKMSYLSDMAFWNPSEIIGTNPRPLDYSLYREIITKKEWSQGIAGLGYKLIPNDLMCQIGNKPYISLEKSFEGLIPEKVKVSTNKKLVDYCLNKLRKNPSSHDKIEFEIIYTCYDYSNEHVYKELLSNGFSESEVNEYFCALKELTQNTINEYKKTLDNDLLDLNNLIIITKELEQKILFKETDIFALISYFKELLVAIKRYGTPQFSRQARCAFISRAHCKAMVKEGYFTAEEMDTYLLTIHTVASDFEKDCSDYIQGKMSKLEFNKKYGHLRSGTYNIRTLRYDEMDFTAHASDNNSNKKPTKDLNNNLDDNILIKALEKIDMNIAVDKYKLFLKSALEMRESFKFEFTKALSLALNCLVLIGQAMNISRNELSYLNVSDILASEYYDSREELYNFWKTLISERKKKYKQYERIILPELIWEEDNIAEVHFSASRANYITNQTVKGELIMLDGNVDMTSMSLSGKVVVIEKADPGYDWIFAQNIAGLITKYGGAASHMAIRCAEFGIPAAIGCGEKIYSTLSPERLVIINCKKGEIRQL